MNRYEPEAGESIYNYVRRIKGYLLTHDETFAPCNFNGVEFIIHDDSDVADIITIYNLYFELESLRRR